MKPSSIIGHCHELLAEILRRPTFPADITISRFFRDRRYLGSRDRGAISETVYNALRNVLRVRVLLREIVRKATPDREASIQLAALPAGADLSVADIAEGTHLAPAQVADIRARLRAAEEEAATLDEPMRSAIRYSLPEWFVAGIMEEHGAGASALLEALNRQAPITLRANRLNADRDTLIARLRSRDIDCIEGRYSSDAVILRRRLNANAIPEFKMGWFELQDEGSQLLSLTLDPRPTWNVFDACAGAGGKALHMAAIMKGRGGITAHDVNSRRLAELRPRLKRSGAQNVRIMEHEAYTSRRDSLLGTFDAVMIDAPCSGTGVLRRNPGARLALDESMIGRVTRLQHEILDEYAPLVKPGGLMLYATCSLLRVENEVQVESFLSRTEGWSSEPVRPIDSLPTEGPFFRTLPTSEPDSPDGFFGALLRRA